MNILGIHTGHDATLSLIIDNKLVAAISMERFSRFKKDWNITRENFDRFLNYCGVTLDDIDCITMGYWKKHNIKFCEIYSPQNEQYPLSIYNRSNKEISLMMDNDTYFEDRPWLNKIELNEGKGYSLPPMIDRIRPPYSSWGMSHSNAFKLNVTIENYDRVIPGFFVDHHVSHASSTFYTSPFNESSIFTVDASMHEPTSCSGYFWGNGESLNILRTPGYTYGNFYDVATEYCGQGPGTTKAGTLMGLSSFGNVSKKAKNNWGYWTRPYERRSGTEDSHYNDWLFLQMSGKYPYVNTLRPEVKNKEPGYEHFNREYQMVYTKEESDSQEVMNIAADIQYVAERSLVKYSQDLYDETRTINDGNLCVAGGTFLNCNANYKIATETSFKNIHIFPACGDDGVAVGSSLYILHQHFGITRQQYTNSELAYLGFQYKYQPKSKYKSLDYDVDMVSKSISEGKIICWFQGRSEFGPRALGNRSFISDPRKKEMKDQLNSRVKFREWFRPFAPVILNEHKEEWFKMDFESPFMLYTVPCKKPQEIPSAVHIDNTSRVQTLRKEDNQAFYELIEKFYEITGVPIVMNTSLNVKGQPIVETPEEAMKLFEESDVDILVINDKMYFKN
jgi:carbamoyltransferase